LFLLSIRNELQHFTNVAQQAKKVFTVLFSKKFLEIGKETNFVF
jgi:hypothetical protein